MTDFFNTFLNTDDMVSLLSSTSTELVPYLLAIQDLQEIPRYKADTTLINGVFQLHDLNLPFASSLPSLNSVASKKQLIKELAKIEGIEQKIKSEQQHAIAKFTSIFTPLRELDPIGDIELVKGFANAPSLVTAFCPTASDDINLLPNFASGSEALLHAALANQMAGLSAPAALLYQLFTEKQLIESNEGFQTLLSEITKYKGHKEASSTAGKKGRNKRYEKSDKVKAYAIELYCNSNFDNIHQASQSILSRVAKFGESIGYRFTSEYQAPRTIETWLRKYEKANDQ